MKIITGKLNSQIKDLSKGQKLLIYTGLFIFTITSIYQLGLVFGKFYYYITH